jgi:pyruvate dehydrogenase E2 component (dihydrolipoamide acetyltransferase)
MATPVTVGSAGGEYMESVVVVEWALALGAPVKAGELLLTVETAKAATEIEAPCDGFLTDILAEPGAEVSLTEVIGLIGSTAEDTALGADAAALSLSAGEASAPAGRSLQKAPAAPPPSAGRGRIVASPAARRKAERAGIDLSRITPSSPSGRIKLRDLAGTAGVYGDRASEAPLPPASVALPPDESGPLKIYRSGPAVGEAVVMLHGFGGDALTWYPLEPALAATRHIIRIELPSHGASPRRRMGSFRRLARDVVEAFDGLGLDRAHVVGHSLGGACALALADVRPQKLVSLALLAPAGLGPEIDPVFAEGFARASHPESLSQWLKCTVADRRLISADFVKAAMDARADPMMRAAQLQMARDIFPDGTQGFDLRGALDRAAMPTRIVWGKADAILPWRQALTAPGRVGLHLFDGAGHLLQFERTEAVLAILQDLFAAAGGQEKLAARGK